MNIDRIHVQKTGIISPRPPGGISKELKLIREISNFQGLIVSRLNEIEKRQDQHNGCIELLMGDLIPRLKKECEEELGRIEIV